MADYDINDGIRLWFETEGANGPANPTGVRLRVVGPTGVTVHDESWPGDADITNPVTGRFERVVIPDVSGRWAYKWEGSGDVVTATPWRYFHVTDDDPAVTP